MKDLIGTADDFRRGYDDAYYWRRPSPNSLRYIEGYERGVYVREVTEELRQDRRATVSNEDSV